MKHGGSWSRRITGWSGLVVVSVVAGCGTDSTPNALDAKGKEASHGVTVWWILLGAAVFVGIVIVALIAWSSLQGPRENPGGLRDDTFIALGGVVLPAVILIPVAVLTVVFTTLMRQDSPGDDADAVDVTIVGHQYWWEIRYPELGIETANELTIPVDRPIDLSLRSADVIHSFWVPQIAGKQDLVPGQTNRLRIEATESGDYWGLCAEFCGEQHGNMSFVVHVTDDDGFDEWADDHRATPTDDADDADDEVASDPLLRRGRAVFDDAGCAGCHTIAGTDAQGEEGPDLTDLASRSTLGAGVLDNTDADLATWITDTQDVKPGAEMLSFPLPDEDIEALVAYLRSDR